VAALLLVVVAAGVFLVIQEAQPQAQAPAGHECGAQPSTRASLFSDDSVTQIRLSTQDLGSIRVLREERAEELPGMFDSLLALSDDGSRLAYVTARNPFMDEARIWAIDVARPGLPTEAVRVPSGLWPLRPAWSADKRRIAFVTVEDTGSAGRFRLWSADLGGRAAPPTMIGEVAADRFTRGRPSAICWDQGRPAVVDASPGTSASGLAGPVQPGGSSCAVPAYSQNDPAWRRVSVAAGDPTGGFGCALTASAVLLNYQGADVGPAKLSGCLGPPTGPLRWGQAPACIGEPLAGGEQVAFSWSRLDSVLRSGQPAIVRLVGGQTGTHYVVVTAGGGGNGWDYSIVDPWDGSTTKTLGSYFDVGYNPRTIVTYSAPARSCNRVRSGPSGGFNLAGGADGGVYRDAVSLTLNGSGAEVGVSVVDVSIGKNSTARVTPGPSAAGKRAAPERRQLPFSLSLRDEGAYEVVVQPWPLNPGNRVSKFKLTVDRTPPWVEVGFAGTLPTRSVGRTAARVLPNAAAEKPQVRSPVTLRTSSHDNLSGVAQIEYQLDGGAWTPNSDDMSLKRLVTVDALGDHVLASRATDLAGNVSSPVSFEFTVAPDAPPLVEAPAPAPTPRAGSIPTTPRSATGTPIGVPSTPNTTRPPSPSPPRSPPPTVTAPPPPTVSAPPPPTTPAPPPSSPPPTPPPASPPALPLLPTLPSLPIR
jgi:hypothetical protein